MAMAMDEQLLEEDSFSVQLQVGEEITLIPWDDEPFVVTHVFLVDPESAASGQRVVAAARIKTTCAKMGTQNIMLAQLSSEMTEVELEAPVVLDAESCFYVTRLAGDDTDTDKDALVVQFKGFVLYPDEESDEESEDKEEGGEEAASLEDDKDDGSDKDDGEEDKESGGEVDRVAKKVGGLHLQQF